VLSISTALREIAENLLSQTKVVRHYFLLRAVRSEIFRLGFIGELNQLIEQFKETENTRLLSDFNRIISEQFLEEQTPFIFERLGNQFESILIDEFQDTSNLQWLNLIPLVENSLSVAKTSLIVGDAKQSIYRFRGSEPQQFIDLPNVNHPSSSLFASSYQEHVLNSNYRSARNIIDFNNRFFEQYSQNILSSDLIQTYSDLKQEFISDESGEVNWWFTSPDAGSSKEDALQMMISRTIDLVTKEKVNPGDVCCLFRMNSDAAVFASSLLKSGIGVISEESLLLKNNPAVALLISTLTASRYPKDNFHLQQWLSKYHHIHRINNYHLLAQNLKKEKWNLEKLMNKVGLDFNPQILLQGDMFSKMFNLVKLFELNLSDPFTLKLLDFCTEFESSATYLKTSFLEHWKKAEDALSIQLPEGKNAVRVMSIHKSKGLEFPVVMVFMPSLNKAKQTKEESWVSLDEELGIQQISLKTSALKSTTFEAVYDQENDKSSLDFINTLYVAFTRAESQLEVFSNPPSSKNTSLDFIKTWSEWDDEKSLLHLGN
jgi:ATP-dependent exoDNAse (exonuclease V) beta subunit